MKVLTRGKAAAPAVPMVEDVAAVVAVEAVEVAPGESDETGMTPSENTPAHLLLARVQVAMQVTRLLGDSCLLRQRGRSYPNPLPSKAVATSDTYRARSRKFFRLSDPAGYCLGTVRRYSRQISFLRQWYSTLKIFLGRDSPSRTAAWPGSRRTTGWRTF